MVANPIQKQKRNSMLIGLIVGLVIGLVLCVILYLFLTSNTGASLTSGDTTKNVAVLNKSIKSGAEITTADYEIKKVNATSVPTDAVGGISGTAVAKIDLTAGTVLSNSMLTTTDSKLTKDLREQEYNMITLPTQLATGDYIDIRLQLPDGGDYIVVSKKYVQKADATTVWLNMNEEEILVMSNAIVEYYIMTGSKLYATKYTEPGTQEAATPTYCPNATVVDLINGQLKNDENPNGNIESLIQGRFSEKLKSIRNSRIKTQLDKYNDTGLENLETNIQEEIKNLQESRQAYFGVLDSAN